MTIIQYCLSDIVVYAYLRASMIDGPRHVLTDRDFPYLLLDIGGISCWHKVPQ